MSTNSSAYKHTDLAHGEESRKQGCLLKQGIVESNLNLSVVAAFMCALAVAIYVDTAVPPQCFGEEIVKWQRGISWFSMGCFFVTIPSSVLIVMDVGGVPDQLMLRHVKNAGTSWLHCVPNIFVLFGLILMPVAYGIDIGERNGCAWSVFGFFAAPAFVAMVIGMAVLLKLQRGKLNTELTREAFFILDTNQSGTISANELRVIMKNVDQTITDVELEATLKRLINKRDSNGDGELDYNEFMATQDTQVKQGMKILGRIWFTPYLDLIPTTALLEEPQLAIYQCIMSGHL